MNPERIEELMDGNPWDAEREEMDYLLRCARVVAELEAFELVSVVATNAKGVSIHATRGVYDTRGDLLTAVEAALARAKDGGA